MGKRLNPEDLELPRRKLDKKAIDEVPSFYEMDSTNHKPGWLKPKKAFAAYHFFSQHYREELKLKKPNLSHTELTKAIGTKWGPMTKNERAPYEKTAVEDRKRYDREKREFDLKQRKPEVFTK